MLSDDASYVATATELARDDELGITTGPSKAVAGHQLVAETPDLCPGKVSVVATVVFEIDDNPELIRKLLKRAKSLEVLRGDDDVEAPLLDEDDLAHKPAAANVPM